MPGSRQPIFRGRCHKIAFTHQLNEHYGKLLRFISVLQVLAANSNGTKRITLSINPQCAVALIMLYFGHLIAITSNLVATQNKNPIRSFIFIFRWIGDWPIVLIRSFVRTWFGNAYCVCFEQLGQRQRWNAIDSQLPYVDSCILNKLKIP